MKVLRFALIFMFLALLGSVLHAKSPWGVLAGVPEEIYFNTYAIDNLIDKRPIRYAVSKEVSPQEEAIFKNSIRKWPAETLRFIQQSGRAQEFRDIIPFLQSPLPMERSSTPEDADVYFVITQEHACGDAVACFKRPEENPYAAVVVVAEQRDDLKTLSLHEIGHYFGLADQYETANHAPHPEYSSDVNQQEKSVMDENAELTCDDADGFINLFDLRLAQRHDGSFSGRAAKGWNSLCRSSNNRYQKAKTVNRKRFDTWGMDVLDTEVILQREYEKGNIKQETLSFPDSPMHIFQVSEQDKITRDPKTRLITSVHTSMNTHLGSNKVAAPLILEKYFTYGTLTTCNGQKCMPIDVQEVVNGKRIRRRQVSILADGSLTGDVAVFLSPKQYTTVDLGTNISFKIEDRKITFFALQNEAHEIDLRGFPEQSELFRFRGDEKEICSLPLQGGCKELDFYYNTLYKAHRDHLMSFYKNFYAPLFGNKQEQVRKQVQDSIRLR